MKRVLIVLFVGVGACSGKTEGPNGQESTNGAAGTGGYADSTSSGGQVATGGSAEGVGGATAGGESSMGGTAGAGTEGGAWRQVASGAWHTCGIRSSGTLWCWGTNESGQLGDGSTEPSPVPVRVVAAEEANGEPAWNDWLAVAAGNSHTCGLRSPGTLWCWGRGPAGHLGDGSRTTTRTTPTQVLTPEELSDPSSWDDWQAVTAGMDHTCGLRDGTLWCWGSGLAGRRGDGITDEVRTTPVQVLGAEGLEPWNDWMKAAAGGVHTCGISGGGAWCWGAGMHGSLGNGVSLEIATTPKPVLAAPGAEEESWSDWWHITTGGAHSCGLRTDGSAWCWGSNGTLPGIEAIYGQRGDGTQQIESSRPAPVVVAEGSPEGARWYDWQGLTAGAYHTCGLRGGGVWCWGRGQLGQRGDGSTDETRVTPSEVDVQPAALGGDFVDVQAGSDHTCALREDGSLWCWGAGEFGQLGDGSTEPVRSRPVVVVEPVE